MKTKLLIVFILLYFSTNVKSQSILAGGYGDSDYHSDINPDFVLIGNGNSYPIDINGDDVIDVTIKGYQIGWNYRFGDISIITAEHCKIACSRIDTVKAVITKGECTGAVDRYYNLTQNFTYLDSISSSNNWSDSTRNYVIYDDVQLCSGNNSYFTSSEIVGVQLLIETDTLYGWIKLSNMQLYQFEEASVTIEEYACNTLVTKIDELKIEELKISPNPCKDILTVKLTNYLDSGMFSLFDLQGKKLFQMQTNSSYFKIDISYFPRGIYVFKYYDKKFTESGKIIKE